MSRVCPRCRESPPGDEALCPTHGLYAIDDGRLERLDEAPLLGQVLDGRYALVDYLGGGGMGAVYRGLQLPLERPVAVKVLHAMLTATREARDRFAQEAKAVSRLRSHHTVTLYDYGVVREGALANVAFMVMEHVVGESLQARLDRGRCSVEEIDAVLEGICRSLAEAHEIGVVHRDIKPENILLTTTPAGDRLVKVIDFGVARVEGADRTASGVLLGTPQYMAPEQCSTARRCPLDARVDVYALGVILYRALSGELPFDGDDALGVLIKQMTAAPPPLPGAESDPRLARLQPVVMKALEKAPERRYVSVTELVAAFHDAATDPDATTPYVRVRSTRPEPLDVTAPEPRPSPAVAFDSMGEASGQVTTLDLPPPSAPSRRGWVLGGVALLAAVVVAVLMARPEATMPEGDAADDTPHVVTLPRRAAASRPERVERPPVVEPVADAPAAEEPAAAARPYTPRTQPRARPKPKPTTAPERRRTRRSATPRDDEVSEERRAEAARRAQAGRYTKSLIRVLEKRDCTGTRVIARELRKLGYAGVTERYATQIEDVCRPQPAAGAGKGRVRTVDDMH